MLTLLSLMLCTMAFAQQEISGTVTDAMGPVIGATVMEKGVQHIVKRLTTRVKGKAQSFNVTFDVLVR